MKNETNKTEKLTYPEKNFVSDLKHIAGEARRQAYCRANTLLIVRNWLIGWRIVEQEQNGKERADYGKHVIELASKTLSEEFGKGFGLTSIKNMRSFYLMFSKLQIGQAMLDQFKLTNGSIRRVPLDESTIPFYPNQPIFFWGGSNQFEISHFLYDLKLHLNQSFDF